MYTNILVAHDGSQSAAHALERAATLAKSHVAALSVLWVRSALPHFPGTLDEVSEEKEAADKFFAQIREQTQKLAQTVGIDIVIESRSGHAAEAIVQFAKERKIDLVVVGITGHSGVWGRVMGHTAERVSEHAACDVLIVR
jgi:nucleotide-binding universal stress UspA family protein